MLDEKSLTAYRKRWQAVALRETAENQYTTTTDRWRQLNALLRLAQTLEILPPTKTSTRTKAASAGRPSIKPASTSSGSKTTP
jgi:hypothetical protein